MSTRKKLLFVDDDLGFLSAVTELLGEYSKGTWDIFTAQNHAQALTVLHRNQLHVVVLDLSMPVMDGLQFLRVLARTHPGQQVAILTGRATDEARRTCLEAGAALMLEKPTKSAGFAQVFTELNALAEKQPPSSFRGQVQRIGLQEVLQLECLGRKSSVLEIFTPNIRGRIYIQNGSIIHAESGALKGEAALYGLLALRGGEFNMLPFSEPPRRSIEGHWEFLLMEAARLTDEGTTFLPAPADQAKPPQAVPSPAPLATSRESPPPSVKEAPPRAEEGAHLPSATEIQPPGEIPSPAAAGRIQEVALCSGAGELLYEWQCPQLAARLRLLEEIENRAAQASVLAPLGRFDRLEILTAQDRAICQVQPDRRLFVRSARSERQPP
jgi:CheY-like chemotaxis protein